MLWAERGLHARRTRRGGGMGIALLAAVLGLAVPAGIAHAGPDTVSWSQGGAGVPDLDKAKLDKLRPDMAVLHDGNGHYVVTIPFGHIDTMFYGDGKTFFAVPVQGGGMSPHDGRSERRFWAPNSYNNGDLNLAAGNHWTVRCDGRHTPLLVLDKARARAMLAKAHFKKRRWQRQIYALARDTRGNYYYVDILRDSRSYSERLDDPEPPRGFRLFIGRKGRLKALSLTDASPDSKGVVLTSRRGDLSIDLTAKKVVWSHGKHSTTLVFLPMPENARLVYRDLGLYHRLGTPCDDF